MSALAKRCLSFAVLALVFTSATGCSGSKSGDTSSDPASPTATDAVTASTPASVAADAVDPAVIDPCKKLALADVQTLFSATLSAKHDDDLFGSAAGCIYHTPDDHTNVQVVVVSGMHAQSSYDANSKRNGVPVPIPGIGDKAVRQPNDVYVYAMKNGVFCMVDGDMHSRRSLEGAEKYTDAPIPDPVAAPLAARLASLCTTLWQ